PSPPRRTKPMGEHTPTPGPWEIREGFSYETWEIFPTREGPPDFGDWAELATVHGDYGDDDGQEGLANARLIAAAPELLAALREFVEASERTGVQHDAL